MANYLAGDPLPAADFNWTTWTPTLTNLTLGNGTRVGRYRRIANTVTFYFRFTLGSSSAVGSSPSFSLPVAMHSTYNNTAALPFGGELRNDGVTALQAHLAYSSSTVVIVNYWNATPAPAQTTVSTPFTWGTGDRITVWGTYETA